MEVSSENQCLKHMTVPKLSNTGWKFINRFLVLYRNRLCYYRKAPKGVGASLDENLFLKMKVKPKYVIPLHCIKRVDKPHQSIVKQYKKLKPFITSTMLVEFNLNSRYNRRQQDALNRSLTPTRKDLLKAQTLSAIKRKGKRGDSPALQNSLTGLGRRVNGAGDDSFRIQESEELEDEVEEKQEKEGVWYFSFESPSTCNHWIKRIESAIDSHVSSELAKHGTGFSGLLNQSQDDLSRELPDLVDDIGPPKATPTRTPNFQPAPAIDKALAGAEQERKKDAFQYMSDDSDDDVNPAEHLGETVFDDQQVQG